MLPLARSCDASSATPVLLSAGHPPFVANLSRESFAQRMAPYLDDWYAAADSRPANRASRSRGSHVKSGSPRAVRREVVSTLPLVGLGRHFPDNPTPADHIRFLHGSDDGKSRYVGLRRLGEGDLVSHPAVPDRKISKDPVSGLVGWVDHLVGEQNLYATQATYFWGANTDPNKARTTAAYAQDIGVVFVDLDIYSRPEQVGKDPIQVAQEVIGLCLQNGLPAPLMMSSGRGLYAYWALTKRLVLKGKDKQVNIDLWKMVQNRILGLLQPFGADPKVTDITRVLRLVGSTNPKSGSQVRVLIDDGQRFDFESLVKAVLDLPVFETRKDKSSNSAPEPGARTPRKLKGVKKGITSAITAGVSRDHLDALARMVTNDEAMLGPLGVMRMRAFRMFADIARLIQMRGGIANGQRDETIFWMLVSRFNAGLYTHDELPCLAAQFSHLCETPLDLWESGALSSLYERMVSQTEELGEFRAPVAKQIKSAGGFSVSAGPGNRSERLKGHSPAPVGFGSGRAVSRVYTPSVALLIDKLGITALEQQSMDILFGVQEKAHRRRAKGGSDRARHARNEQVRFELRRGVSAQAVAEQFAVSVSSVYRIASQGRTIHTSLRRSSTKKIICPSLVLSTYSQFPKYSTRQLAQHLGMSASSVYRIVAAHRAEVRTQNTNRTLEQCALRNRSFDPKSLLSNSFYSPTHPLGPCVRIVSYSCFSFVSKGTVQPWEEKRKERRKEFYTLTADDLGCSLGGGTQVCAAEDKVLLASESDEFHRRWPHAMPELPRTRERLEL